MRQCRFASRDYRAPALFRAVRGETIRESPESGVYCDHCGEDPDQPPPPRCRREHEGC
jgi:hypothetical protein